MPGHVFTSAEAKAAQKRGTNLKKQALKLQAEANALGFTGDIVSDLKDVIVELIRASQANPLIGITVSLVTVDVLFKFKVIGLTTTKILYGIILGAAGITAASEIESLIPGLSALIGNQDAAKLLIPTPTTLTSVQAEQKAGSSTGNKTADAMVGAALGQIAKVAAAA